jgi:hypothetical protein
MEEARFFWQGFQHHQQELIGCIERQSFDDFEDLVSHSFSSVGIYC